VTASVLADPDAAIAAYPGATLVYNQFGIYSLRDESRGLSTTSRSPRCRSSPLTGS
jgi:hypothetical protein